MVYFIRTTFVAAVVVLLGCGPHDPPPDCGGDDFCA
jgi:hypothetical protein